jgi:glycosyltransferase involved in cell wall biosynthesis
MIDKDQLLLHVTGSSVTSASRIYRESQSVLDLGLFSRTVALGLVEKGTGELEMHASGLEIYRFPSAKMKVTSRFPAAPRLLLKLVSLYSLIEYYLWIARKAVQLRPTAISCHHFNVLLVSLLVAKLSRAHFVYNPHELESHRTGLSPWRRWLTERFERLCLTQIKAMIVVCEPIKSWYQSRFPHIRIHVVRSIPDVHVSSSEDLDFRAALRSKLAVPEAAKLFVYHGVLSKERGVPLLLKAFEASTSSHLLLMGFGTSFELAKDVAARHHFVHVLPAVDQQDLPKHTLAADIGLIVFPDPLSESYRVCLPNKFFEYLNAGLPVVVSSNLSYLSEIVQQHGIGWVIDTNASLAQIESVVDHGYLQARRNVEAYRRANTFEQERLVFVDVYRNA